MPVKKDPAKRTKNGTGAYKSKVEYIKDKNVEVYDRIIFSVPKGYKQKLQDYMQERINEIEQLESIAERTEEQEQLLADLKTKYKISTRRTPSISGLISALIEAETGIPVERRETKD